MCVVQDVPQHLGGSQQGTGVIHMYRAARVRSAPSDTFECLQSVFGQQGFAVQHGAMRG
jgi:hypothetical protein